MIIFPSPFFSHTLTWSMKWFPLIDSRGNIFTILSPLLLKMGPCLSSYAFDIFMETSGILSVCVWEARFTCELWSEIAGGGIAARTRYLLYLHRHGDYSWKDETKWSLFVQIFKRKRVEIHKLRRSVQGWLSVALFVWRRVKITCRHISYIRYN